jgi:hypothetical protein
MRIFFNANNCLDSARRAFHTSLSWSETHSLLRKDGEGQSYPNVPSPNFSSISYLLMGLEPRNVWLINDDAGEDDEDDEASRSCWDVIVIPSSSSFLQGCVCYVCDNHAQTRIFILKIPLGSCPTKPHYGLMINRIHIPPGDTDGSSDCSSKVNSTSDVRYWTRKLAH